MTLSLTPPASAAALAQRWLALEPQKALANFTWVNNITVGAPYCRFAYDEEGCCLTLHTALPFCAIAIAGDDPAAIQRLAAELLPAGQTAFSLAPADIVQSLETIADILDRRAEWQMLYTRPPDSLPAAQARLLTLADLPAALTLAAADNMMVFGPDTFNRGPFFGLFRDAKLIAMGGVQNWLPGYAEIGSIITHPDHRRQGCATQIVIALIHHLHDLGIAPFLCLFQSNAPARRLYEKLGFEIINTLHLLEWRLR